jgi:hypothetical protein
MIFYLDIHSATKILKTVIIPKACYLAHLWDCSHKLSLYHILKEVLHVPFNPPAEALHTFSGIKPVPLQYTALRLGLVGQLIKQSQIEIFEFSKSPLSQVLRAETAKLCRVRVIASYSDLNLEFLKKHKIKSHVISLWRSRWKNFSLNWASEGLLNTLMCSDQLLDSNTKPQTNW